MQSTLLVQSDVYILRSWASVLTITAEIAVRVLLRRAERFRAPRVLHSIKSFFSINHY